MQLVYLLANTCFEINITKQYIIGLSEREDVINRDSKDLIKDDRIRKFQVTDVIARKNGCSTLYVNDVTAVLRKQVYFFDEDEIMFRPEQANAF